MFKQAISLLTYRKTSTMLMVLLLAIVVFLVVSIGPLFDAINQNTFGVYTQEYGMQHAVFFNLTEEQTSKVRNNAAAERVGIIQNYGNYAVEGAERKLTLGRFDEEAFSLGKIEILEGRLPKSENEIALEEYWINILPRGSGIGSSISVEVGEGRYVAYTICGWIENYQAKWNAPDEIFPGVNDFPSGLVSGAVISGQNIVTDTMIYMHTGRETDPAVGEIVQLYDKLGGVPASNLLLNDALYSQLPLARMQLFSIYRVFFTLIIIIGASVVLCIALFSHYRSYLDVAKRLHSIGAKGKEILILLLLWSGLLAILGITAGIILSTLFSWITQSLLQVSIYPFAEWPKLLIFMAGVLGVAGLYYCFKIRPLMKASLSDQNGKEKVQKLSTEDIASSLALGNINKNWVRIVAVLLVIALLPAMAFCIQWDVAHRYEIKNPEVPRLAAGTATNWISAPFGDFEYFSLSRFFSIEDVHKMEKLPGVLQVLKRYAGMNATLLTPEKDDDYWEFIYRTYRDSMTEEQALATAIPEGARGTAHGYKIVVLDAQTLPYFQEQYPEIDVEKELAKGKAILFCPPLTAETGQRLHQDALRAGDALRFGMITSDASVEEIMENPSRVRYYEETFDISLVKEESYYVEGAYFIESGEGIPTIIISDETAKSTSFLNQIDAFTLALDPNISDTDYEAVKKEFLRLAYSVPGIVINVTRDEQAFIQYLRHTLQLTFGILAAAIGGFILFSLFSVIYSTLLQRSRTLGILRAAGYRKRELFKATLLEMGGYWAILTLLTYVITLFGGYQFSLNIANPIMQPENLINLATWTGIFSLSMLLLFIGMAWVLTYRIWKKSISSSIRFAE